jgi:hypothetical protein
MFSGMTPPIVELQHCPLDPTGKGHDLGVSVFRGVLTMRVVLCDLLSLSYSPGSKQLGKPSLLARWLSHCSLKLAERGKLLLSS